MERKFGILVVFVVALVFMTALIGMPTVSEARPAAGPTPISVDYPNRGASLEDVFSGVVITQSANSGRLLVQDKSVMHLQYVVDQNVGNALTLTLQTSNKGTDWVDVTNIVTGSTSDLNDMVILPTSGRYNRLAVTLGGSDPVTITEVSALLK